MDERGARGGSSSGRRPRVVTWKDKALSAALIGFLPTVITGGLTALLREPAAYHGMVDGQCVRVFGSGASRLLLGPLAFGLPGGYVSPTVAFAVAAVLLAMFAVGGAAEGGAQMLVPVALCVWLLLGMLALMAAY
tara:strand:+ start:805 stop:1209 length:405 start_codon:yes stop_codon:yes gene_type:complete